MNIPTKKKKWLFYITTLTHIGYKALTLSSQKSWHPSTSNLILGSRNNRAIIHWKKTHNLIIQALFVIALIFKSQGHLLVINGNPTFFNFFNSVETCLRLNMVARMDDHTSSMEKKNQSKKETALSFESKKTAVDVIPTYKHKLLLSYSNEKWIGGLLTNWNQISKNIHIFAKFSKNLNNFVIENNINFPQYKKMNKTLKGFFKYTGKENKTIAAKTKKHYFLAFKKKPDLIFLINPSHNKNIINEAIRLNIPIIAVTDTNNSLSGITLPIPSNNNSIFFVYLCLNWIIKFLTYNK